VVSGVRPYTGITPDAEVAVVPVMFPGLTTAVYEVTTSPP
jgi:hypothetical protein